MNFTPFELERFFAQHEFTAQHLLCASDCESLSVKDLLEMQPDSKQLLEELWLGYTESLGHPELRNEISKLYKTISKTQVLVHTGAEEAIYNFIQCSFSKGDHLIVHWPCYQSLYQVALDKGCEVTRWQADPVNNWELDEAFLKNNIRPNTKAVILNMPHNPTGYLMEKNKFLRVIEIVKQAGCYLFMDEVYRGLEPAELQLPAACDLYDNAISLGVMSKSLGLAGLRIGWIATKNEVLFDKMAQFKDYTTICNSAPSEFFSTLALRNSEKILKRNREIIAVNLKELKTFFKTHADIFEINIPKAGCIAFPRLIKEDADVFCEGLLIKTGVLLAPASKFNYDSHFFRIGFGRKNFAEGLQKIDSALKSNTTK